jgi:hypothetical protein
MSTFGKKYLNYWPYRFDDVSQNLNRWNKTDKDFQLKILKKWYPIGMRGKAILAGKTTMCSLTWGNLFEITGYIEYQYGWKLDVDYVDSNFRKDVHPIKFIPEEVDRLRILRELRLEKLLD